MIAASLQTKPDSTFVRSVHLVDGRSRRDLSAGVDVSNNRGVDITILGALVSEGVVNLSLGRPQAVT